MFNFESFLVERNTQVELLQKDFEKLGYEKFDYPTSTTLAAAAYNLKEPSLIQNLKVLLVV